MPRTARVAGRTACALLLAMPAFLVGCGSPSSLGEACEDTGEACGWSDTQIDQCQAAFDRSRTIASDVGCGSLFAALESCAVDHYETPTDDECSENTVEDNPSCSAEQSAYLACLTEKCSADPSKCAFQ